MVPTPLVSTATPIATNQAVFRGVDLTHQSINGYRVLHRLGVGGMAEVYLAFHESLQRHVALKVLRPDLASSTDHTARFLQEARAAASLIHPNIVQVYDVGSADGIQYIAQEYISGTTLRNLISKRGSLKLSEALSIVSQIASALAKSASIGVVHRDIKPDNILLTPEGEVKVADFGLARARTQNTNLTEVGVALGTPIYMSPEQIQGQAVDHRSDLYSLGITAFELLSGRPPFQGDTPLALAMQHVQNTAPNICELRPDVDEEFGALIARLLSKNAESRPNSASEVGRIVRTIADRLSIRFSAEHPHPLSGIVIDNSVAIGQHTTRLQAIALKGSNQKRRSWIGWCRSVLPRVAAILLLAGVSFYLPYQLNRKPVLESPEKLSTSIRKRRDVREQYFYAMRSDSPAEWRSVEEFFPPETSPINRNYNVKAWLHIAWHALSIGNPDLALQSAQKILSISQVEPTMRVLALIVRAMATESRRPSSEVSNDLTQARMEFKTLSESEQKLIENSLPSNARSFWFQES